MRRVVVVALGVAVLISGVAAAGVLLRRRLLPAQPAACAHPSPGSQNDLTQDPPYTAPGVFHWTDDRGCLVRRDVIMTRTGAEHCGWQAARHIVIGNPLGSPARAGAARDYVRDPGGVLRKPQIIAAFRRDAELPADATETGYRWDGAQLWMRPGDDSFAYLVYSKRVERWPRDRMPSGCE